MFLFKVVLALALVSVVSGQCARPDDKYIGDLCYSISNQKLSFSDAQSSCYTLNQNLAVIHTTLQANFIASIVRSQTGASEGKFWIGLSRVSTSSRFQWDDGSTMFWSNFDANFPKDNNYVTESTINGKWQTLDGVQKLVFVCSYDPSNPGTAQPSTSGYGSTGYPASVPVTGGTDQTFIPSFPTGSPIPASTGLPFSYPTGSPVSDSTGYPASTFNPVYSTGYPGSVPVSDSTGYPASVSITGGTAETFSASFATGNPGPAGSTGYMISDSTGVNPSTISA